MTRVIAEFIGKRRDLGAVLSASDAKSARPEIYDRDSDQGTATPVWGCADSAS